VLSSCGCITLPREVTMSKSVLIVDDSQAIRRLTRTFLESQTKFEVCGEAVDGLDALEKARDLHPDLIILDFSMPRMDGLHVAKELKRTMSQIPVILFTVYADAIDLKDVSSAGVSAVVSKSDDLSVLAERVEYLLDVV
jgi:DNA-binding NarL/FixJ family response regulator